MRVFHHKLTKFNADYQNSISLSHHLTLACEKLTWYCYLLLRNVNKNPKNTRNFSISSSHPRLNPTLISADAERTRGMKKFEIRENIREKRKSWNSLFNFSREIALFPWECAVSSFSPFISHGIPNGPRCRFMIFQQYFHILWAREMWCAQLHPLQNTFCGVAARVRMRVKPTQSDDESQTSEIYCVILVKYLNLIQQKEHVRELRKFSSLPHSSLSNMSAHFFLPAESCTSVKKYFREFVDMLLRCVFYGLARPDKLRVYADACVRDAAGWEYQKIRHIHTLWLGSKAPTEFGVCLKICAWFCFNMNANIQEGGVCGGKIET